MREAAQIAVVSRKKGVPESEPTFTKRAGSRTVASMNTPKPIRRMFHRVAVAILALVALPACTTSVPIGKPVPVKAGEDLRASVAAAGRIDVYEGLPHQTKEVELLQREVARQDVIRIHGYPFYTPAVPAMAQESLRQLLADPRSYAVYSGPKTCGGFHPDYAVHWEAGGRPYHILICYGCGEALFSDGERLLPYDVRHGPLDRLRASLAGHARKRPAAGG